MSVTLVLGMAAVAGAIGLGWMAATSRPAQAKVHGGLASIEQYYARELDLEPDAPQLNAALSAPMARLGAVASRLSPANALDRLQRHLDIAGNPGRWTAQRVLAFKGVGLVALGAAADPATGRPGTSAWVTPHLVAAMATFVWLAWSFTALYGHILRQHAVIQRIMNEVRLVRESRGLEV